MKKVALGLSEGVDPRGKFCVALGLSGGVDSAVAALLLKRQGYDVHCIYLNCFDEDIPGCKTKEDRKDALSVALYLGLPFQVLDLRKEYQESVIDYFKREYEAGRTPNPDVVCNRDIKFGLFYKWAVDGSHFEFLATGHYAKLVRAGDSDAILSKVARRSKSSLNGRPARISQGLSSQELTDGQFPRKTASSSQEVYLSRPKDEFKDQTYFLWQVPRERFSRVLFPLGDYLKSEVRAIARDAKLPVSEKKDSTGICFIGEVSVGGFLKRLGVKEKEGEVVIRVAQNPKSETLNPKQIQNSNNSNRRNKKSLKNLDLEHLNLFRNSDLKIRNSDAYRVIGRHRGVAFYTIGQRHGFEISNKLQVTSDKQDRPPLYVIEKDVEHNRLVVGFGAECYRSQFSCGRLNWLARGTMRDARGKGNSYTLHASRFASLFVRIRHGGELIRCQLQVTSDKPSSRGPQAEGLQVTLASPVRGIAAGQSAVFYSKSGIVFGGGVIR